MTHYELKFLISRVVLFLHVLWIFSQINLYVKVNKTVSLKVRRSETIENLRVLLRHKEGVSEDLQLLEFNGKEICDHSGSVTHCGIQNNSTISLRQMSEKKLHFKFRSGHGSVWFGLKLSRTDLNRLFYKKNRIRTELNKNRTQ